MNNYIPFILKLVFIISAAIFVQPSDRGSDPEVDLSFGFLNEDEEIIYVDYGPPYCNVSNSYHRNTCYYGGTNKTIRLIDDGVYPLLEFIIYEPTRLIFHPVCIPWIFVYNASYFTTLPAFTSQQKLCSTWISLLNSVVDDLSYGIHDVFLDNCTVQKIFLKEQRDFRFRRSHVEHLEWIDWKGYDGDMDNSSISTLSHLSTSEAFFLRNSDIGDIKLEAMQIVKGILKINNTKIRSIETNGVTVLNGALILNDVTIQQLYTLAFVVSATTNVMMRNVKIINGSSPSFLFPSSQNVKLINVTIEGEQLKYDSKWIEEFDRDFKGKLVTKDTKGCTEDEGSLECNFMGIREKLFIHLNELEGISTVIIKNAYRLSVNNPHCYLKNITLLHSNVFEVSGQNEMNTICNSTLRIRNCSVESIATSTFAHLELRDSSIGYVEVENVTDYYFENSTFNEIKSLVTNNDEPEGVIENCRINLITRADINGPLTITNSSVNEVKKFIMNHQNESSNFTNITLTDISYKGIVLNSGHLILDDVTFSNLVHESVFVGTNGTLSINNSRPIPSTGHGFLSVINRDQVNLRVPLLVVEEDWFYTFRSANSTDSGSSPFHFENEVILNETLLPSPYCHTFTASIFCDFEDLSNAAVTVSFLSSEPYSLQLKNVYFLILHSLCSTKVAIQKISNGTILRSEELCPFTLKIDESNLMRITTGAYELSINSSTVTLFAPNTPLISTVIRYSEISVANGVTVAETAEVDHTKIKVVEEIVVLGKFVFSNGHIDLVKFMGITVEDMESEIKGSIIGTVQERGFTIRGALLIANTVIEHAEGLAFDIYGLLKLENVEIRNGSARSFNMIRSGSLQFTNVKINGEPVTINQKIIQIESENGSTQKSIATQGLKTTKEKLLTTITATKLLPEKETSALLLNFTEHVSLVTEKHTSPSFKNHSPTSKTILMSSTNEWNDGLSWLGAVLGFLLGIVVSTLTLYALLIFRPNSKILKFPSTRWHIREDQQELVSTDENEEEMRERRLDTEQF